MKTADVMLQEFDQEARTTRRFLERLPEDQLEWRPHPKSMTAGQLAFHIASSPGPIIQMAQHDSMAVQEIGRSNPQPKSVAEILEAHDASLAKVKEVLPTFTDDQMQATWRLNVGGKERMAIPRAAMLRMILLNHIYHHRGQFGVYLRLLGAKVPSSYGPSGDEFPEFMDE